MFITFGESVYAFDLAWPSDYVLDIFPIVIIRVIFLLFERTTDVQRVQQIIPINSKY